MKSKTRKSGASERLVADFETTTDPHDCRVWLWAVASIDDEDVIEWGTDILTFVRFCAQRDSIISFHNLRFDAMFLLDWLLKNDYAHTETYVQLGQFSTLINDQGQFYSLKVKWRNGCHTEFRDSYKKLPMTVERIAQSFRLPESKGTIDYDAFRPVGYYPSQVELDYIFSDVLIVARALNQQASVGMSHLTVGSDALHQFYDIMPIPFRNLFPTLNETVDADVRRAYRGGFTYADPRFRGQITGQGRVYDVNSLYPSVMYARPMPYGEPLLWAAGPPTVTEEYPLYIQTVTMTATLKPDHIPCIPDKNVGRFGAAAIYLTEIAEPRQFTMTSVDWALWCDHYDVEVWSYDGAWLFRSVEGVFRDYIDKWSKVKAESTGGLRELAKLMLNSLYGKFATNPDVTGKVPYLKEDPEFPGQSIVALRKGKDQSRDPIYTPVGVFITAYARDVTIRAAQENYDRFAYCDTDSLHLLIPDDPPTLDIHPNKLGAWKHELTFDAALFVRPKCYTERTVDTEAAQQLRWAYDPDNDGDHHTHIAGMPVSVAALMRFEDFSNGRTFRGKLSPRRVPGGVILDDVGFTLNTGNLESDTHGTQD